MEGQFVRSSPQRASYNLVIGKKARGSRPTTDYYQKQMQRGQESYKRRSDVSTLEGYLSDSGSSQNRDMADGYYRGQAKVHGQGSEARNSYTERKAVPLANTNWKTVMSPNSIGGVAFSRTNTHPADGSVPGSSEPVSTSNSHNHHHHYPKWHKKSPEKGNLYRSNSSLDIDQVDGVSAPSPPKGTLRRDYGSTSSLDLLGQSQINTDKDGFFSMLKNYRNDNVDQRSPAPPKMHQLLRGKLDLSKSTENNSVGAFSPTVKSNNVTELIEQGNGDVLTSPKTKQKFAKKEKKQKGSKGGSGDSGPAIFRKFRGNKSDSAESAGKGSDGAGDSEGKVDDKLRQKAFIHYDCQSIGLNLMEVIKNRNFLNKRRNTATGASAASVSYMGGNDVDDMQDENDVGDGKSNDLVLNCPFFRNELGGEEERTISLTRYSAQRRMQHFLGNQNICDQTSRPPLCNGVAVIDPSPTLDGFSEQPVIMHKGYVIEYVDQGAYYYRNYFLPYEHQNYFGNDDNLGPVAISVLRTKVDDGDRNSGKGENPMSMYRIIVRTSELVTCRGSVPEDVIPSSSRLSSNRGLPAKDIFEFVTPEINLSCLKLAVAGPKTCEELMKLDEQGISKTYKVGVMYCRSNQCTEEEMYNNEHAGPAFKEFLDCIGEEIRLKNFDGYRAGLDNKTDSTGTHSMYATFKDYEIMFHVSTMLPYTPNNKQQLLRKCHIGNDIVTIIFQEPGALPFTPKTVRSHFQHVFIIVQVHNPNTDNVRYSVAVSRSKDVPPFGPAIPEGAMFPKSQEFAHFLLTKVINAENAVHKSHKFVAMAVRTRQEYLKGLAANYTTNITPEAGSKLGKFALGSGRKKDKVKQRTIPDMSALGAIVWNVLIEDFGKSQQIDCLLGIARELLVLVEEEGKGVVFAVHCQSIIGWTSQGNSIRLYYGEGECFVMKTATSDTEEIQEIVNRLTGLTTGCETAEMTLRRNGLGQLGFHVEQEGIVSGVEVGGFAWQKGLRQNCRLVEICKTPTATLTHDQMIDLLRTSLTVNVILIPPNEDGTVRRGYDPTAKHSISASGDFMGSQGRLSLRFDEKFTGPRGASSYGDIHSASLDARFSQSSSNTPSRQSQHKDYAEIQNLFDDDLSTSSNPTSRQSAYKDYIDLNALSESQKAQAKVEDALNVSGDRSDSKESLETTSSKGWQPRPYQATSRETRDPKNFQEGGSHGERWYESDHSGTDTNRYSDPGHAGPGVYLTRSVGSNQSAFSPVTKKSSHTPQDSVDSDTSAGYHKHSVKPHGGRIQDQSTSSSNLSQISDLSSHSYSSGSSQGKDTGASHPHHPQHHHHRHHGHSGNRQHTGHDRVRDQQKDDRRPQFLSPSTKASRRLRDVSPMSSANSSPRSSNKNLTTIANDDVPTRLRPGVSLHTNIKPTEALRERSFQEELMRLINPDLSEADIREPVNKRDHREYKHSSRPTSMVSPTDFKLPSRLQRTLSDESICGANTPRSTGLNPLTAATSDVIYTPGKPVPPVAQRMVGLTKEQRLSPRATTGTPTKSLRSSMPQPRQDPSPIMPFPDNPSDMQWSNLVDAATRVFETGHSGEAGGSSARTNDSHTDTERSPSKSSKPSREPTVQDKLSVSVRNHPLGAPIPWRSHAPGSSGASKKEQEFEARCMQLEEELEKERKEKQELRAEVERLQKDNLRLQEESQTAAAQLRKFTEWFFNTIDRQ